LDVTPSSKTFESGTEMPYRAADKRANTVALLVAAPVAVRVAVLVVVFVVEPVAGAAVPLRFPAI